MIFNEGELLTNLFSSFPIIFKIKCKLTVNIFKILEFRIFMVILTVNFFIEDKMNING
jgi:hypothetical protein